MWLHMPIITALRRLSRENHGFKISEGYAVSKYLKQNKQREREIDR